MTVYVRLPTQQTISVQVDRYLHSTAELKHLIYNKIGLPDKKGTILTHLGKPLDFVKLLERSGTGSKLLNDVNNYHMATIYVCLVLPGGADQASSEDSGFSEATLKATLKNFMKLIGSLSLTDREIMRIINSLSDL